MWSLLKIAEYRTAKESFSKERYTEEVTEPTGIHSRHHKLHSDNTKLPLFGANIPVLVCQSIITPKYSAACDVTLIVASHLAEYFAGVQKGLESFSLPY